MEKYIIQIISSDPETIGSLLALAQDINVFVNHFINLSNSLNHSDFNLQNVVNTDNLLSVFKAGLTQATYDCLNILNPTYSLEKISSMDTSQELAGNTSKPVTLVDFLGEPIPKKPLMSKSHFCIGQMFDMLQHASTKCCDLCNGLKKIAVDTFDWIKIDTNFTVNVVEGEEAKPFFVINTSDASDLTTITVTYATDTFDLTCVYNNLRDIITSDNIRLIFATTWQGVEHIYDLDLRNGLGPLRDAVTRAQKDFFRKERSIYRRSYKHFTDRDRYQHKAFWLTDSDVDENTDWELNRISFRLRVSEQKKAILESLLKSRDDSFMIGEVPSNMRDMEDLGGSKTVSLDPSHVTRYHNGNLLDFHPMESNVLDDPQEGPSGLHSRHFNPQQQALQENLEGGSYEVTIKREEFEEIPSQDYADLDIQQLEETKDKGKKRARDSDGSDNGASGSKKPKDK